MNEAQQEAERTYQFHLSQVIPIKWLKMNQALG